MYKTIVVYIIAKHTQTDDEICSGKQNWMDYGTLRTLEVNYIINDDSYFDPETLWACKQLTHTLNEDKHER